MKQDRTLLLRALRVLAYLALVYAGWVGVTLTFASLEIWLVVVGVALMVVVAAAAHALRRWKPPVTG